LHAVGAADSDKGKKDLEYKAKAEGSKSVWNKPNAQVGGKRILQLHSVLRTFVPGKISKAQAAPHFESKAILMNAFACSTRMHESILGDL